MRVIVFSDTHGSISAVDKVITANENVCSHFIFLGDGVQEFDIVKEKYTDKHFYSVIGNCDKGGAPEEAVIEIYGAKIYMAHGHLLDVKNSLDGLLKKAREANAEIALFGHTHVRFYENIGGIHVLNPGSASQPEDDLPPSYAFIELSMYSVGCAHVDLDQ